MVIMNQLEYYILLQGILKDYDIPYDYYYEFLDVKEWLQSDEYETIINSGNGELREW